MTLINQLDLKILKTDKISVIYVPAVTEFNVVLFTYIPVILRFRLVNYSPCSVHLSMTE